MYVFVSEDHMLDWHLCQICYPLEMKLLERERDRERERQRERQSMGLFSFKINLNLCDAKFEKQQTNQRKKEMKY